MFIPATTEETAALGWERPDIILVTGDSYVDSPNIGVSVIGHTLMRAGFKTVIIPQPRTDTPEDITRFGEPLLFWGVTSGCVDSMVSNYTASGKRRRGDDLTAGLVNNRRPDRALIVYSNLIRRYYKDTVPIVLGGIEAGLRRIAHYDWKSSSVRGSILFDAKADIIVYGMGENTVTTLAGLLRNKREWRDTKGICFISKTPRPGFVELPSPESAASDKSAFIRMFNLFYENSVTPSGKGLIQKHGDRWLVQNPPAHSLSPSELDAAAELPYERDAHPVHKAEGEVRALDTIRFSVTTHRGCAGECSFCSIAAHQGKSVISRSEDSIIREIESFTSHPKFKGVVSDIGGPTANMYMLRCGNSDSGNPCVSGQCLYPAPCGNLKPGHKAQIRLLERVRALDKVKKGFVSSGIRHDLVVWDKEYGYEYLRTLLENHTPGRLRVAPEHTEERVLRVMKKPPFKIFRSFMELFKKASRGLKPEPSVSCYLIAAHPGSDMEDMRIMDGKIGKTLGYTPEDVQIFTPLPSTYSTAVYYTETDPYTGKSIFVEKNIREKETQKKTVVKSMHKKKN